MTEHNKKEGTSKNEVPSLYVTENGGVLPQRGIKKTCEACTYPHKRGCLCSYERKPSRTPAATAEPMTPATLGPMACMSR